MDFGNSARNAAFSVDAEVERVIENSGFVERAARMAQSRGLSGSAATQYATGLVDAARQRLRTDLVQACQEARQQVRSHVQGVITHPAAQGQQKRALRLALDPNIDRETAIAELKKSGDASTDASALARSILGLGGE